MDFLRCEILCFVFVIFAVIANTVGDEDQDKDAIIQQLRQQLVQKDQEIVQKDQEIVQKDQEIVQQRQENVQKDQEIVQKDQKIVQQNQELLVTHCGQDFRMAHNWLELHFMNWEFVYSNSEYYNILSETLYDRFVAKTNDTLELENEKEKTPKISKLLVDFCKHVYKAPIKRFKWAMFLRWITESEEYLSSEESKKLTNFSIELKKLLERKLTLENLLDCISFHWKVSTQDLKLGNDTNYIEKSRWLMYTQDLYENLISLNPHEIKYAMRNEIFLKEFCGELFRRTINGRNQTIITRRDKDQVEKFPEWFQQGRFEPVTMNEDLDRAAKSFTVGRAIKKTTSKPRN